MGKEINIILVHKNCDFTPLKERLSSDGYTFTQLERVGDINPNLKEGVRNILVEDDSVFFEEFVKVGYEAVFFPANVYLKYYRDERDIDSIYDAINKP